MWIPYLKHETEERTQDWYHNILIVTLRAVQDKQLKKITSTMSRKSRTHTNYLTSVRTFNISSFFYIVLGFKDQKIKTL